MTLKPKLTTAGKYTVVQIPSPHFSQKIDLTAPPTGILHTTEGGWAGSLAILHQHFAPQFMVGLNASYHALKKMAVMADHMGISMPEIHDHISALNPTDGVEIAQLVPVGYIGAAIVTHNWMARVQIEMIGYSKTTPWIPDDKTVDALASLMVTCEKEYNIPLSRPWPTGVFGMAGKTKHRNDGHFGKVAGWFGHGDCPSPDTHWDPGNLQWDKVFAHAESLKGK